MKTFYILAAWLLLLCAGCATRQSNKHHLSNVELYKMSFPTASAARWQAIGRFVTLEVIVEIQREAPLVKIVVPKGVAGSPKRDWIYAHLLYFSSTPEFKVGDRLKVNGIIVDESYGAYMIYVLGTPERMAVSEMLTSPPEQTFADNLIVTGTMKQIIGTFSTYGHVRVGDTFELNLMHLPKGKIDFTRPNFDQKKATRPYVPFSSPLIVENIEQGRTESVGCLVRLSSTATDRTRAKLVIQMHTPVLRKGSQVWIKIYEEDFGNIGCMAEAEGVLK